MQTWSQAALANTIVLYCTVLYCAVMYVAMLGCNILYRTYTLLKT